MSVENFRVHQRLDLEPAPVTVVIGPNGSGKTTLQAALEWAFAGRCRYTDTRGLNGGLLRQGAHSGSVTITDRQGQSSWTRYIEPHGLTLSWSDGKKTADLQAELERQMGCTAHQALVCLDANWLLGPKAPSPVESLWQLLRLHLTPERVLSELQVLEKRTSLPVVAEARNVLTNIGNDCARGYKTCYTVRTEVNRAVKSLKSDLARLEAEDRETPHFEAVDPGLLEQQRAAVQELLRQQGELRAQRQERERAEKDLEQARARLARAQDALQSADTAEQLAACETRLGQVRGELQRTRDHEAETRRVKSEAEQLAGKAVPLRACLEGESVCPWKAGWPCAPLASERRAEAQAELSRIEEARLQLLPVAERPSLADKLTDLQARVTKGEHLVADLRAKVASAQGLNLQELEDQVARLEERLSTLPVVEEGELATLLEQASRGLAKLEEQQKGHEHCYRLGDQLDKLRGKLASEEKRAATLTALVEAFDGDKPTSIRGTVFAAEVEGLVTEIDATLSRWGMGVRYTLDGGMEVRPGWVKQTPQPAAHAGSVGASVDYERLSTGERMLVQLAHQVALAILSGLRIVVLDCIESLDKASLAKLFEVCLASADQVDHFILLGVALNAEPPRGVKVVRFGGAA